MRNKRLYHILFIAAIGLIAYSNVFNAPFVFDDLNAESGIVRNPVIKDPGNFILGFKGYEYNPRRFVGYLTFALNYYIGGLDVTGYHVVNLLIHLTNAILVYILVLLIFRTPYFRSETSGDNSKKSVVSSKKEETGDDGFSLLTTTYSLFTTSYSRYFALAVALLFVAHPVQTQAVTYIVQRFTSLATLFYLLAVVMYIKGRQIQVEAKVEVEKDSSSNLRSHSSSWTLTSTLTCFILFLISAACAMRTKEIAFTLPLMILLCEFIFFRSSLKRKLPVLTVVMLILAIVAVSVLNMDKPLGAVLSDLSEKTRVQTDMPRGDYLMTEMRVIVTYVRLIFFPVNQNLYYDYPIYRSFFAPQVFLSFLFLTALIGLAVYLLYKSKNRKKEVSCEKLAVRRTIEDNGSEKSVVSGQQEENGNGGPKTNGFLPLTTHYSLFTTHCLRLIAFGILWFFIALSVESSIIPIEDVIFEHRLYLPSVGAFITIAAFLSLVAGRVKFRQRLGKAVIPGLVALVVALTAATWARNTVWQDEVTLMEDVAQKSPRNVKVRNGLGNAYMTKGWNDKAIEQLLIAVTLRPDYARARNSLGVAYGRKGMLDEALEEFSYALSLEPRDPEIYNNIGVVYRAKGDTDREITYFQAALKFDPNLAVAHYNLGKAYTKMGWKEKSDEHFVRAHALDPDTY